MMQNAGTANDSFPPAGKNPTNSTNFDDPLGAFTLKPAAMSPMASLHDD
jgi:hypothetical protein